MLIEFDPRFHHNIRIGVKNHTIRKKHQGRYFPDCILQMTDKINGHDTNIFYESYCLHIQNIEMIYKGGEDIDIIIDGVVIDVQQVRGELVSRCGFESWIEFFKWFHPKIEAAGENRLEFDLIHWTNNKY